MEREFDQDLINKMIAEVQYMFLTGDREEVAYASGMCDVLDTLKMIDEELVQELLSLQVAAVNRYIAEENDE